MSGRATRVSNAEKTNMKTVMVFKSHDQLGNTDRKKPVSDLKREKYGTPRGR